MHDRVLIMFKLNDCGYFKISFSDLMVKDIDVKNMITYFASIQV